jgi:hypothetical protein
MRRARDVRRHAGRSQSPADRHLPARFAVRRAPGSTATGGVYIFHPAPDGAGYCDRSGGGKDDRGSPAPASGPFTFSTGNRSSSDAIRSITGPHSPGNV